MTWIYTQGRICSQFAEQADQVLAEFDETARSLGLTPVLWHGTCLGIVRDGGYPETDPDIDVAVEAKGRDRLMRKLINQGFARGIGENHLIKARMHLDIYVYDGETETVEYKGREYSVPSPVEEMLEQWYGRGWRVPVRMVGIGTMIKTDVRYDGEMYMLSPMRYRGKAEVAFLHKFHDDARRPVSSVIELDDSCLLIKVKQGVLVRMEETGHIEKELKK